jgi:hypothetical protein
MEAKSSVEVRACFLARSGWGSRVSEFRPPITNAVLAGRYSEPWRVHQLARALIRQMSMSTSPLTTWYCEYMLSVP